MEQEIWRLGCFGVVLVWFVLLISLSRRIKIGHPSAYETLGLPALLGNPFKGTWTLGAFLYSGRFLQLRDPVVTSICFVMCFWFIGGIIWMFGPFLGVFSLT